MTGTSSIGTTIFNSLWGILIQLFKDIANGFGILLQEAFGGLGQSIMMMFQSFGYSMSGYGVWAPLMFVVGLGVALLVGYLLFDVIDSEKDITGAENDL